MSAYLTSRQKQRSDGRSWLNFGLRTANSGRQRLRLSLLLLLLLGGTGVSWAQTTNRPAPVPPSYSSFRLITDRNIFNPRRYPRSSGITRRETPSSRSYTRADYLALVGTMSYEKGPFAFFEGSSSEYRKVLQCSGEVAGCKVLEIRPSFVRLLIGTHTTGASLPALTNSLAGTNLALGTNGLVATNLAAGTNQLASTNLLENTNALAGSNLAATTNLVAEATNTVTDPIASAGTNNIIELQVGMQLRRERGGEWRLAGPVEREAERYIPSSSISSYSRFSTGRFGFSGTQPGFPGAQPGFPGSQPGFPTGQPGFPGAQPGFPTGASNGEQPVIVVDTNGQPVNGEPPAEGGPAQTMATPAPGPGGAEGGDSILQRLLQRAAAERGDSR